MTDHKHTPGPWYLYDPGYSPGHVRTFHIHSRDTLVVTMSDLNSFCKADARLIAAAPELLGALEAALEQLEWCDENAVDCDEVRDAIAKARAAIAKATGGVS